MMHGFRPEPPEFFTMFWCPKCAWAGLMGDTRHNVPGERDSDKCEIPPLPLRYNIAWGSHTKAVEAVDWVQEQEADDE